MHPEQDMSVKNEVFLEIPKASVMGVLLPGLAGGFIYVAVLALIAIAWAYIHVEHWNASMGKTLIIISAIITFSIACILLSLVARPPYRTV
jgi:hypothetical protein